MSDAASIRNYLSRNSWPAGLQQLVIDSISNIAIRYFICDDSGSMMSNDGHRLVESNPTPKFVFYSNSLNARLTMTIHINKLAYGHHTAD